MVLGIAIGIRYSISFTSDFIPAQWSDFDFWSEKWQEIGENIKGRRQFPGIYWEQEVMGRLGRIAGGVLASPGLLGIIACIHKRKQKKFHF